MKLLFRSLGYALAGLVLAVGLTAAAYAIGGRDLSEPARPFKLDNRGNPEVGAVDDGKKVTEPDDSPSPEDSASPDDKGGDEPDDESGSNSGSGSSNSGSGSSNSGSGSSNSGSGSGDDEPDDD